MTPEQYRDEIDKLERGINPGTDWYMALGLTGEAGEVADKIKKSYRNPPYNTPLDYIDLAHELGDVLWYLDRLAAQRDFTLSDIMDLNIVKLKDRHARGAIPGHGDHR